VKSRSGFILLRFCAVVVAAAAPVHAQHVDGRFRLGLEGAVLETETVKISSDRVFSDPTNPARSVDEVEITSTNAGLPSSTLGVVAGYGLSDSFVLGARLLWSTQSREADFPGSQAQEARVFGVLPHLEYVFSPGSSFRPYLVGLFGLRSGESSLGDTTVASFSQWRIGAGVGAHAFAAESFSIDPMLAFYGVSAREVVGDVEFEGFGSAITLSIGLSGWLGGGPVPSRAAVAAPARSAAPQPRATGAPEQAPELESESQVPESDRVVVRQGIVGVRVGLPDRAEVRLVGNPAKSGTTAVVHLVAYDKAGLDGCRSLRLVSDDVAHELRDVRYSDRAIGHGTIPALQATVAIEALAHVAEAQKGASIVACERNWAIGLVRRERIQKFIEVFAGRARAAGTWRDAERDGEPEPSRFSPTPE
jgi:hypothetical protein